MNIFYGKLDTFKSNEFNIYFKCYIFVITFKNRKQKRIRKFLEFFIRNIVNNQKMFYRGRGEKIRKKFKKMSRDIFELMTKRENSIVAVIASPMMHLALTTLLFCPSNSAARSNMMLQLHHQSNEWTSGAIRNSGSRVKLRGNNRADNVALYGEITRIDSRRSITST